jgi:two-component system OmpR family sensor kinase
MRLPIRLRLTLAFAVGMAVVLACLGTFLYVRLGTELLASIDLGLRSRAQIVEAGIPEGSFTEQPNGLSDPDEAFAQVLDRSGAILESSPEVAHAPLVGPADLHFRGPTFVNRAVAGLEDPARLLIVPVAGGRSVVVGATLSDRGEALDQLLALFAIGGPVALLLISLAGWAIAGAALRPVERMRVEAAAISASEPERRLPVPAGDDELVRLAATLNAMLGRLQESLARERRFVDDAAHELRTPLAILNGELELALSRPRTAEELEATIRRASAESERLALLAEDLLVLARAQEGRLPVHREDVSLGAVVAAACAGRRATASAAGVTITADGGDRRASVDRARVRQAVENLLDNAIRHSPAGGEVRVANGGGDGRVWVRVEDDGPGFPPEVLPVAFEPFSGTSANGDGAGLGLAIAHAVAVAHGGDATAENLPGRGARVTITLRA